MPVHDPHQELLVPASGASVLPTNHRRRRRRSVHVTSHVKKKAQTTTASRVPLEPIDFDFDHNNPSTNQQKKKMLPIMEIQSPKKKTTTATPKSRKKTKQREFARTSSAPSPYKPTLPPIPSQKYGDILPQILTQSQPQLVAAPPCHVRHALLVDTRTLDTEQGSAVSQSFLHNLRHFLSSMRCRGMAPHLLACLHLATGTTSPTRSRPPMAAKALRILGNARLTVSVDCFCETLPIQPATNAGNVRNVQAVKVPTRLLAQASWKAFGDLVEEAVQQDQKSSPATRMVPLTVTLVTNDVALFCDSEHKEAVQKFWNRMRPFFHKNNLRSIELVVMQTGTVTVLAPETESMAVFEGNEDKLENEMNDVAPVDKDQQDNAAKSKKAPATSVAQCAQQIRQYMTELERADYKVDRGREDAVTPISMSLSLCDNNSRSFTSIGRRWMSQLLSPPDLKGNISFELPETMDGTQCSISLDVRYRLLPYAADSPSIRGMLADLDLLSSSTIETMQLVPVSCIDANLLFGVAMEVLPGFQNDEDRFHEMKGLVYVLLKQLRDKDVALLLRSKSPFHAKSTFGKPLHHMCHQTYLLMAQDFPDTKLSQEEATVPLEASLFRYGNADQLISVDSTADLYTPEDSILLSQLHDYVDSALDMIPKDSINPLVIEEVRVLREMEKMTLVEGAAAHAAVPAANNNKSAAASQDQDIEMDDWNDTSGVGSLVVKESSEDIIQATAITPVVDSKEVRKMHAEWNDETGVGALTVKLSQAQEGIDDGDLPITIKPKTKDVVKATKTLKANKRTKANKTASPKSVVSKVAAQLACEKKSQDATELQQEYDIDSAEAMTRATPLQKSDTTSVPKQKKTAPKNGGKESSRSADALDDISEPGSQDSLDDISENGAPAITMTQHKQDKSSIFDQLTSSDESEDDWKGYKGVGFGASQKTKCITATPSWSLRMVSKAGAPTTKQRTNTNKGGDEDSGSTSSSSDDDDDALFSNMFKESSTNMQSPAAALLQSFDDTDSDTD